MATVRVKVEGLSDIKKALDGLSRSMGRGAIQRAALAAMEPMARAARQLAPKDEGELSESIAVGFAAKDEELGNVAYGNAMRQGASEADALAAMRTARRNAKGERGALYVDVFMGPVAGRTKDEVIKGFVQEFGRSDMFGTPYMRPAFEREARPTMERLKKNLEFEVFAAVAKAAARKPKG